MVADCVRRPKIPLISAAATRRFRDQVLYRRPERMGTVSGSEDPKRKPAPIAVTSLPCDEQGEFPVDRMGASEMFPEILDAARLVPARAGLAAHATSHIGSPPSRSAWITSRSICTAATIGPAPSICVMQNPRSAGVGTAEALFQYRARYRST